MGSAPCCVSRDRNDKVYGIETRNSKFFYYNFPLLVKDIDTRLLDARVNLSQAQIERSSQSTSRATMHLSSLDINHFRWLKSQLIIEIESNRMNLYAERMQQYKRRLAVEVCDSEGLNKVQLGNGTKLSQCKCLVRIQFGGIQKKTKKNINCTNPKFYEIFRYNMQNQTNEE